MHIFYTPDIKEKIYTLNENESKHCIRVLRLRKGDQVTLVDGAGGYFIGTIIDPNLKKCTIEVTSSHHEYNKKNYHLHIAIAPTKNTDRFEWFLEKATEIGIDEITPILCEHSERKNIKHERLEKIIISAMKQSVRAYKPALNKLTKFASFIESAAFQRINKKYIAHCENIHIDHIKEHYNKGEDCIILIGPEGDFSSSEIDQARKNRYQEVSLGPSRLRTETAGIVAAHAISMINE